MDTKVDKIAYYDAKVVQQKPLYGIQKGCLSITNHKSSAISKSSNSANWSVNMPSLNVNLDRQIRWNADVMLHLRVQRGDWVDEKGVPNVPFVENTPVITYGTDWVFNSFPLHRMVNNMSATINDAVCTRDVANTLHELLMLREGDNKLRNHTTPAYMSKYAGYYANTRVTANSSFASCSNSKSLETPPNGAYSDWYYCDVNGNKIPQPMAVEDDDDDTKFAVNYDIYVRLVATENLFLSPFQFDKDGDGSSLFGINNFQVQTQFRDPSRMIQFSPQMTSILDETNPFRSDMKVSFASSDPFKVCDLHCIFMTPPIDLELPKVNIVNYEEYPRFLTNDTLSGELKKTIVSNTITLPSVPDYLLVYVKKQNYPLQENDYHFHITNCNIVFDNFSGLLSTMTAEELYEMSYNNGLKLDWNNYQGKKMLNGEPIQGIGGFLVIKMGKDLPLQSGIASGVGGNFSCQITATIDNWSAIGAGNATPITMVVVAPTSGYFVSSAGSSSIHKNFLTESDVMSAKSLGASTQDLERAVGSGFFDKLSSAIGKAGKAVKSFVSDPKNQSMAKDMAVSYAKNKLMGNGEMPSVSGGSASISGGNRKVKLSKLLR